MRRKIKNSLSLKVFLWVFSALIICSTLIYGIVLTVLPRQYQFTSNKQLYSNTQILVSRLQDMSYEDAVNEIYNFCIENNSAAKLRSDKETVSFGAIKTSPANTKSQSQASQHSLLLRTARQNIHLWYLLCRRLPISL